MTDAFLDTRKVEEVSGVSSSSSSEEEQEEEEEEEEELIRQRRLHTRRGSMPEREIDCEDTETAELQSNLRRCQLAGRSGSDRSESEEDRRARRGGSNPEREIFTDDTETAEFQSNLRKLPTFSKSAGFISEQPDSPPEPELETSARPVRSNKTVFRPAMRCKQASPAKNDLRRSRSWQGLTSGLRYSESVSDAGMPPPPPAPANKR